MKTVNIKRTINTANAMYNNIKENLEQLLNTRTFALDLPHDSTSGALLKYGIPDYSHLSWLSQNDQKTLCHSFIDAISHQDPRLTKVKVNFLGQGERPGTIKLEINAYLEDKPLQMITNLNIVQQNINFTEAYYG